MKKMHTSRRRAATFWFRLVFPACLFVHVALQADGSVALAGGVESRVEEQPHAVDLTRVVVRGVLNPDTQTFVTVCRLHLVGALSGEELRLFLNPGRRVVEVLGPQGETLPWRVSNWRWMVVAAVQHELIVTLPESTSPTDTLAVTLFIEGSVRDEGVFKPGNYLETDGIAVTGGALYPSLGPSLLMEEGEDPYHYLELELDAPAGWTLVTGGLPETENIEPDSPRDTRTSLRGERVDSFFDAHPGEGHARFYWERIGVNAGLFYLYGGPDWVRQSREVGGVPLHMFTTLPDTAVAWGLLRMAEKAMPAVLSELGPFPYEGLTLVVPPRMMLAQYAGAVDSWGMVTVPRWCPAENAGCQETLIHEIVHQYWNESLVTPIDESLALSEPLASYFEAVLWGRVQGDTLAGVRNRVNACWNYWSAAQVYSERPLRGLPVTDPFQVAGHYGKGPLAVAMLADLLGPDEFREMQHEIFSRGEGHPFDLDSLAAVVDRRYPLVGSALVRDLFLTTTHYDYSIRKVDIEDSTAESCAVQVHVARNEGGVFPMLLEASFGDSIRVQRRLDPQARRQTIRIAGPAPLHEVVLDPEVLTLDCDRYNSHYPRVHRSSTAWSRSKYVQCPQPAARWGRADFAERRFVIMPVVDYTDFDGLRPGLGLEINRAYQDRIRGWLVWSRDQERLRSRLQWVWSPRPLSMFKIAADYKDDGLTREALLTTYLPSWRNLVTLSVAAGCEAHPDTVRAAARLRYASGMPTVRLGLTFPALNHYLGYLASPSWWSYLLQVNLSHSPRAADDERGPTRVEGDTRMGIGSGLLDLRARWGLSDRISSEGEAFVLGGRWAYADEDVRVVRGCDVRFARRFFLMNTEAGLFSSLGIRAVAFADLAVLREVATPTDETLFGYGLGVRYTLPERTWLSSATIRLDYALSQDHNEGQLQVGMWSAF